MVNFFDVSQIILRFIEIRELKPAYFQGKNTSGFDLLRKLNVTSTPKNRVAFKPNLVGESSVGIFDGVNFTQKLRLANAKYGMNRVLAIFKNRMSLDWFSADILCRQPPGNYF